MPLPRPCSKRLSWTFVVGRTGLEPVTPCASCVSGRFRTVHGRPLQTPEQDLLFRAVRGRSSGFVGVAVIVAVIFSPHFLTDHLGFSSAGLT